MPRERQRPRWLANEVSTGCRLRLFRWLSHSPCRRGRLRSQMRATAHVYKFIRQIQLYTTQETANDRACSHSSFFFEKCFSKWKMARVLRIRRETGIFKRLPPLPWGKGGEKSPWGFRGKQVGSSCLSSAGFGAAAPSFVPGYPGSGLDAFPPEILLFDG
jgi:hypothetical protein